MVLPVPLLACLILNRIFDTLQMAFLIHGYYLVGVTNFGNFIADLMESPWCVSNFVRLGIDFELEGYDRSLRVQITFGCMCLPNSRMRT
jgi:hypothetical protein